jgi:nucleoside-diphosphate-sugar epimerase
MSKGNILVLGAGGQIGTDLVAALRERHGAESVIASDIKPECPESLSGGPYLKLDAMDRTALESAAKTHNVGTVYHLVAMLSATAEQHPMKGWDLNMQSLFHLLELAREGVINKLFWPSSIAVFGPRSPQTNTPQHTVLEPTTVYGISKVAGESWCEYYHQKHGVDVRSVRYPGLISYKAAPGGGTTDYAVHIFHEALKNSKYTSFIQADRALPMMYMPDAIRATLSIMDAPAEQVKLRSAYNIAGMSFTPAQIGEAIAQHIPDFALDYAPDFRNEIAANWPGSVDDSAAREDWGWEREYDLNRMVADMIAHLRPVVSE